MLSQKGRSCTNNNQTKQKKKKKKKKKKKNKTKRCLLIAFVMMMMAMTSLVGFSTLGVVVAVLMLQCGVGESTPLSTGPRLSASGRWRTPKTYKQSPLCLPDDSASHGAHLKLTPCHALPGQLYLYHNATFRNAKDTSLCITAGNDTVPGSEAMSLDLLPCNGSAAQQFLHNTTTLQLYHKPSNRCVDLDQTDGHLNLYTCNSPVSENQQWNLTRSHSAVYIQPFSSNATCATACSGIEPGNVGSMTGFTQQGNLVRIATNTTATINVTVYALDVFRISAGTVRPFHDTVGSEIISSTTFDSVCVCMCVCVCVCVCVCLGPRECVCVERKEALRECVCVCVSRQNFCRHRMLSLARPLLLSRKQPWRQATMGLRSPSLLVEW